jgi:DNA-binding IclR family transcriptional regulator
LVHAQMMENAMPQVPAADRTIAVLRYLAGQHRPVTAVAIARDLGLPRSSTYHLLTALAEASFVTHLPQEQRWALGVGAFELGSAYLRSEPLERFSRPLLHRLAHDTAVASHVAVLDGRDVVYLATERPPQTVPLVVDVGVRLPAHLTASGRTLLATRTSAQLHALFPDRASLTRRTEAGPTTPAALRRVLREVQRDGVGREDGEVDPRLASVAVAARDHLDRAVAAITLTFLSSEHDRSARDVLAAQARVVADLLTSRLGGRAASAPPITPPITPS